GSAVTTLRPPTPATEGAFGAAVADLAGDLLVGAPGTGTVHLFRGATGEPLRTFASPGGARRFGAAVAAVGANVLIGAPGSGDARGHRCGPPGRYPVRRRPGARGRRGLSVRSGDGGASRRAPQGSAALRGSLRHGGSRLRRPCARRRPRR